MVAGIPLPALRKFASDACLESDCELAADDADESLKPGVEGEVGLVGDDESGAAPATFLFCASAIAF